jgi:hypothetical protein
MYDLNPLGFQIAVYLKPASRTSGSHQVSACFQYGPNLVLSDAQGHIGMFHLERSPSPAADIRTDHFDELQLRDALSKLEGLLYSWLRAGGRDRDMSLVPEPAEGIFQIKRERY